MKMLVDQRIHTEEFKEQGVEVFTNGKTYRRLVDATGRLNIMLPLDHELHMIDRWYAVIDCDLITSRPTINGKRVRLTTLVVNWVEHSPEAYNTLIWSPPKEQMLYSHWQKSNTQTRKAGRPTEPETVLLTVELSSVASVILYPKNPSQPLKVKAIRDALILAFHEENERWWNFINFNSRK
jgi:hypothetical protein